MDWMAWSGDLSTGHGKQLWRPSCITVDDPYEDLKDDAWLHSLHTAVILVIHQFKRIPRRPALPLQHRPMTFKKPEDHTSWRVDSSILVCFPPR